MNTNKPKPGGPGGAPFATPGKNLGGPVANQTLVALRSELKQLTTDLEAIASGHAGSTFAEGDKSRLEARIAHLKSLLSDFDPHASKAT
jgi:hypothetical protein